MTRKTAKLRRQNPRLQPFDVTLVQVIDALFDLGQGHHAGSIELHWSVWQKLRSLVPAAKRIPK